MSKITNAVAATLIVGALAFSTLKSNAQKVLNWNFNVPTIENVDSVDMKIIDNGENTIYNERVPLVGSSNEIPTDAPIVRSAGFDVKTYGMGNKAMINVNTVYDQNLSVEVYDLSGRLVDKKSQAVRMGENSFSLDMERYSSSQYILKIVGKDGYSNSRITNIGGTKNVSTAKVKSLESMLKSASGWKFIVSNSKLLTDTFYLAPSNIMDLNGSLYSRPTISGQVLDILNMVGKDGKRKLDSIGRFIDEVGIEGMKVFLDGLENDFVVTGPGGYFNLRPDKGESVDGLLKDTLYILNHFNTVDMYQFKMPFAVKSGEILDVNGKPSRLITFPIKVIEGLDYGRRPMSEDLLAGLRQMIEIETLIYPNFSEYNGTLLNIDLLKKPVKVFLDRENSESKAYSDTIMAGLKLYR